MAEAAAKKTAKKTVKKAPKKTAKKTVRKTVARKATPDSGEIAVIETGGKQYVVSAGDTIKIEKLNGEIGEGDTVTFDKVLLVDNGSDTTIGEPYIENAKVLGELVENGRNKKLSVIKFRSKSRYFRNKGHRQHYMKVKITGVQ